MDTEQLAIEAARTAQAPDAEVTRRSLDQEFALIESAIRLVERGHSPRVDVVGLRFVDLLVDCLAPAARARGLIVDALWSIDETPTSITVRTGG